MKSETWASSQMLENVIDHVTPSSNLIFLLWHTCRSSLLFIPLLFTKPWDGGLASIETGSNFVFILFKSFVFKSFELS